jgi:hypothetical protein
MSRLQVVHDGAFRRDEGLKAVIAAVVAPSFIDDVRRLEREFDRCDTLYLLRDQRGDVSCLFLVAWETLEVDGRVVPALYTGLSAARPDQKGTGRVVRLYDHCVSEARQWEQCHGAKLVVWGTTATPSVLSAARRVFANAQPSDDGTYSEGSARVARAVARRLGVALPAGAHPFVLPRLATGVRYTAEERRRIDAVCRAKRFSLFDRLGVEEARGDRLLFVAEVPAMPWRPLGRRGNRPHAGGGRSPQGTPAPGTGGNTP